MYFRSYPPLRPELFDGSTKAIKQTGDNSHAQEQKDRFRCANNDKELNNSNHSQQGIQEISDMKGKSRKNGIQD